MTVVSGPSCSKAWPWGSSGQWELSRAGSQAQDPACLPSLWYAEPDASPDMSARHSPGSGPWACECSSEWAPGPAAAGGAGPARDQQRELDTVLLGDSETRRAQGTGSTRAEQGPGAHQPSTHLGLLGLSFLTGDMTAMSAEGSWDTRHTSESRTGPSPGTRDEHTPYIAQNMVPTQVPRTPHVAVRRKLRGRQAAPSCHKSLVLVPVGLGPRDPVWSLRHQRVHHGHCQVRSRLSSHRRRRHHSHNRCHPASAGH